MVHATDLGFVSVFERLMQLQRLHIDVLDAVCMLYVSSRSVSGAVENAITPSLGVLGNHRPILVVEQLVPYVRLKNDVMRNR
jgi:hypothetical protein